jgi:hypothetical protein
MNLRGAIMLILVVNVMFFSAIFYMNLFPQTTKTFKNFMNRQNLSNFTETGTITLP